MGSWKVWWFLIVGLQLGLSSAKTSDWPCDFQTEFSCRNDPTICIALSRVRDGSPDCPDRSDEECDAKTEFQCQTIHQCIPKERFHDGWPDCDDGSDEECGRGQHRCRCGLPHCVDGHKVRDGIKDCDDGSDEDPHQNKTYKCPDEARLQDLMAVEKRRRKRQTREDGSGRPIPSVRVVPTRRAYIRRIKPAGAQGLPPETVGEGYNLVRNNPRFTGSGFGIPEDENFGIVRNLPFRNFPNRDFSPQDGSTTSYGPVRNYPNYFTNRPNPSSEFPVDAYGVPVRNLPNFTPDIPGPVRNSDLSFRPDGQIDGVRNPGFSRVRQNNPPVRDEDLYPNRQNTDVTRNQVNRQPSPESPPRRVIRLRRPQPRPQSGRELNRKPIVNTLPDSENSPLRARGPVVVSSTATVQDIRSPNGVRTPEKNVIDDGQSLPLTYYTTFTYMTTFLNGPSTAYSTREAVVSNVATDTVDPSLVNLIRSRGGFTTFNGVQTAVPLGSRAQGATTTIVNLASRVQIYNSDIYYGKDNTKPPNEDLVKPTGLPSNILPITDIAALPKTYYTLFTYYYTLKDGDKSTHSQRSETISNIVTQTDPFIHQNFENTIDSSGYITLKPDKEHVNLGLRTAGGTTTEVNLELKTLVHFDGLKNIVIDRNGITPSLLEIRPTGTAALLDNYLEPGDAEVQDQQTYPQTVPIQPSFSSDADGQPSNQQTSSNIATPEIPINNRIVRTQTIRGPLRVASTILQRPGTLRSGVFSPRPGVRVRVKPVSTKTNAPSEFDSEFVTTPDFTRTTFETTEEDEYDSTPTSEDFDDEIPVTEEELKALTEDYEDSDKKSRNATPGRKRLKITIRRSPGAGITRTHSRSLTPTRTRPRFFVVTRTGSPTGRSSNRPVSVKVTKRPKSSAQYATYTTITSVPVVFGLSTSYRNALVTSSSLVSDVVPSKTVILTYFTTTTYTVPYTIEGRATYTTLEETNSRVVTETLDADADLSFISSTTTLGYGSKTRILDEPPEIPDYDTTESTSTGQTLKPQVVNNQLHLGTRTNLVTKVSNGVTLIVATDGVMRNTEDPSRTMQPTVVTDNLLMLNKDVTKMYEPRTFYTTFTFFTTFFSGGTPTISTSEQVITNVYTVPVTHTISSTVSPGEPFTLTETSESLVSTTLYSTHTFYATLFNGSETVVTPLEEIQSSVISSTETYTITKTIMPTPSASLPAETRTIELPEDVTTTTTSIFKTLTNFVTLFRGTESVVSPLKETITDVLTLTLDNRESPTSQPQGAYTTRTIQATNTHYITLFSGTESILSSITEVAPSVITELVSQLHQPSYTSIRSTPVMNIPGSLPTVEPTFQDLVPSVRTQYTTLTYFTTLFTDSSTILSSREEVATSYITLFVPAPQPGATTTASDTYTMQDSKSSKESSSTVTPTTEILTFYTTYTYYTTLFRGTETIISDSETVVTQYVTIESTPTDTPVRGSTSAPPGIVRPTMSDPFEIRIEPTASVLGSTAVTSSQSTSSSVPTTSETESEYEIIGVSTKVESGGSTPSILTGIPTTDSNGATHILFTDFIVPSSSIESYPLTPELSSSFITPVLEVSPSMVDVMASSDINTLSDNFYVSTFFTAESSTPSSARDTASDHATTRLTDVNVVTHPMTFRPTTSYHSGSASTMGIKPGAVIDLSDVLTNTNLVGNLGETIKDIVNLFAASGNRARNNASRDTQSSAERPIIPPSGGITVSSAEEPVYIPIGAVGRNTKTSNPAETRPEGVLVQPSTLLTGFTPVLEGEEKYTFDADSSRRRDSSLPPEVSLSGITTSFLFGSDIIFIQPTNVVSEFPTTQQFSQSDGRFRPSPDLGVLQGSVNNHEYQQASQATPGIQNSESTSLITGLETIFFGFPDARQPPRYTTGNIQGTVSTSSIVGIETIFFDTPGDFYIPGSNQLNISGATTIFGSFPGLFGTSSSSTSSPDASFATSSGETTIFFPVPGAGHQDQSSPGTRYVTSVESVTLTLTLTTSSVYNTENNPVTVTSVFTTTIPPRTFVSTIIGSRTILGTQPEPTEAVQVIPTMQPSESTTTVTTTTLIFNSIATTVVRTLVIPTHALQPTKAGTGIGATTESPKLGGGSGRPRVTTERPPISRKPIQLFKSGNRPTEPTTPKPARTGPPLKLFPTRPSTTPTPKPPLRTTPTRKNVFRKPGKTLTPVTDGCLRECNLKNKEVCKQNPDKSWSCQCRPGFFKKEGSEECRDVKSYVVLVRVLKMGGNEVTYNSELDNFLSPEYKNLTTTARKAVDDAYKTSSVGDDFVSTNVLSVSEGRGRTREGVLVNLTVQLSGDKPSSEEFLRDELMHSLEASASDVSITNATLSPIIQKVEDVQDFDECADENYNDCSRSSVCVNLPGTYTCECKEGYQDLEPLLPGRICSGEIKDCDFCNNRGVCIMTEDDKKFCRCYRMYLGKQCEINGLVLAIALPIALALLILTMFCLLCGCRKLRRRRAQKPNPNVYKGMAPPMAGTLDRKAMIIDSSSESSGEHRQQPPPPPTHAYDGFGSDETTTKRSHRSDLLDDRISSDFQMPTVLIPRAKHSHPKQVNVPYPSYRMPTDMDRW